MAIPLYWISYGIHVHNPLVWWMARRLASQCEYACDAAVLAGGFHAGDYAHMLCDLASDATMPSPSLAMASVTGLESRVRRLASASIPADTRHFGLVWIVFTLLVGTSLAILGPAALPVSSRGSAVTLEEVSLRWSANPFPRETQR